MSTPTLDQVFHETPLKPLKTIEEMAAEQGIKPFDFAEARRAAAGIWPEDESLDDFTAWLRQSRNEGAAESRLD
ncbi:MAG: hypothetical protein M3X11_20525 [Acidobacteriota bacterium]|nr:hypothetical protein [Acidobacteriota bacterium]